MLVHENFDGAHVWGKPGLSGYLVCQVHLVSLIQPNKPDRPNRPNEQDRLADFSSILLEQRRGVGRVRIGQCSLLEMGK
jgi:hypothetical protein